MLRYRTLLDDRGKPDSWLPYNWDRNVAEINLENDIKSGDIVSSLLLSIVVADNYVDLRLR